MEIKLAIPIILLSILLGAALSLGEVPKIEEDWVSELDTGEPEPTHEHALFYVVMNDTEVSFLEQRYQLAAWYVHMENNRSDIVHKHREGVTWGDFLETINATLERRDNGTYCGKFKNHSYCGEAAAKLNGENVTDLEKEIQQGDKLVIVLQPEFQEWLEEYKDKKLPPAYKPREVTGRQV